MTVDSTATATRAVRPLGRIGWWVLIVITILLAFNHAAGAFFFSNSTTESMMFMISAALQVLALCVLFIPYRRQELWAWVSTWVSIVPIGLVVSFGTDSIGLFYLATALLMALAQIITWPDFRNR